VADADLDGLLRLLDLLVGQEAWPEVVDLRDRSRRAFLETGRQLWPAASAAEYRLALEAPGPWAAAVLVEGAGTFALGPLSEVAASTHAWADLAPYAPAGPVATLAAHERVVRGEDLSGDDRLDARVLDLPLVLQPWEPAYPLAVYEPEKARFPGPPPPALTPVDLPPPGRPGDDGETGEALEALVRPWQEASDGTFAVAGVEGDAGSAVAALGHTRVGWLDVEAGEALARMAWAGASGGAHGRRRGASVGRFGAWWALAALAGRLDDWPVPPPDLGEEAARLRWALWHPLGPALGWELHVAVEDPDDGLAWAVEAADRVLSPPAPTWLRDRDG
jgi:hypothetical protein